MKLTNLQVNQALQGLNTISQEKLTGRLHYELAKIRKALLPQNEIFVEALGKIDEKDKEAQTKELADLEEEVELPLIQWHDIEDIQMDGVTFQFLEPIINFE